MAMTDFAALTNEQKTAWSLKFWHHARTHSFLNRFTGKGPNAMIQMVTELTKTKKGARAVMTLLADLQGDGVTGDYQLIGNEEALNSFEDVIQIDQLRHANRNTGKLSDQKSIVNFRNASSDALAYWIADRMDQLGFLTLSSLPYTLKTNGALRPVLPTGQNLADLEFAPDPATVAPTANRCFYLTSNGLSRGTGDNAADGVIIPLTYKALVQLKAAAKDSFIRGIKGKGGEEVYHVFVTPMGMADLRLDPDFLANVRAVGVRGSGNELFSGVSSVMVDGMMIHEYHHVFSNEGAAAGSRFGLSGNDIGQRVLLCGAQAMGMADIGIAEWEEEDFDYKNSYGISIGKMFGLKKPQYKGNLSSYNTKEDFGVLTIDTAVSALS